MRTKLESVRTAWSHLACHGEMGLLCAGFSRLASWCGVPARVGGVARCVFGVPTPRTRSLNISIFFADNVQRGLVTNSKLCRPHLRP